ncbi:IclR family transcriptional regulator [Pseudomonas syringae pv. tagetis]|uniref:HTH-type transcriptional repressor AllR n=3 Tax=Pseudomonas syringae group TaxID=136849 RepID=A0A0Q0EKJ0_9PSED|nr:IclR family transcriptional regulator [Pseudomonas syringae group genomosp. 7]KPY86799.1 IclR family transcriptional regulator [Pseudomonas syringae pv. tagetis]RMR08213.1 IclR family transcriptional regulator [Pseudomonas syringae pv. helianthi]RMV45075.1 IclR family transcriptional regulator [Pseudomonas syringae pv. helianthi]RMW19854.1 IclR family transcriptional regulator [Pseudomonas syringae pv. tagetis]RMW23823.1 IclR family transcriptional regulator [Pseudomonas syringae pv. tageti
MHNDSTLPEKTTGKEPAPTGTQTLLRGLGVVQAVAGGARDLKEIARLIGTTRSTTHRLASCLVEERYLRVVPQVGYLLGPKLIELGFQAREEVPLAILARPYLDRLSELTGDTVHLAVREGDDVLYLHKNPGRNGPEMRSRVGHRMPLVRTGIGKALLLDSSLTEWQQLYDASQPGTGRNPLWPAHEQQTWEQLQVRREEYVQGGYAFDLEDNEPSIRCVAAPVRDASKQIVAGISVASTVPYMPLEKMAELVPLIKEIAAQLSADLGG